MSHDIHEQIRKFEFYYSYWIFVWAFFYWIISQRNPWIAKNASPVLALWFVICGTVIGFLYFLWIDESKMILEKTSVLVKILFLLLIVKLIPFWMLRNTKINWVSSWITVIVSFAVYNLFLAWNHTTMYEFYHTVFQSISADDGQTPLLRLIR